MGECENCGSPMGDRNGDTTCASCEAKQMHKVERWKKRGEKKATALWRMRREGGAATYS